LSQIVKLLLSDSELSLSNLIVAVTGSRRAQELARIIRSFGATPYIAPTIGIEIPESSAEQGKQFIMKIIKEKPDYVVFMTGPGVYSLFDIAKRSGIQRSLTDALRNTTIVCRSEKPKIALSHFKLRSNLIPRDENTAKGILRLLQKYDLRDKKIAIFWHGSYSQELSDELQKDGATIFEASTYTYSSKLDSAGALILEEMGFKYESPNEAIVIKLIEKINKGAIDAVTFTSPPSAQELFRIATDHNLEASLRKGLNTKVIVTVIGPSTRRVLEKNDVFVDVMPNTYKMGPMVKSLSDFVNHHYQQQA
jgi:uroporphyrinogen-III synthase